MWITWWWRWRRWWRWRSRLEWVMIMTMMSITMLAFDICLRECIQLIYVDSLYQACCILIYKEETFTRVNCIIRLQILQPLQLRLLPNFPNRTHSCTFGHIVEITFLQIATVSKLAELPLSCLANHLATKRLIVVGIQYNLTTVLMLTEDKLSQWRVYVIKLLYS